MLEIKRTCTTKMMHYRKGENVEKEITKDDLPFGDCLPKDQKDFLWMHVKGGTKVTNVISYAKSALDKSEYRTVIWSGSGGGVVKTISCAEILKRNYQLYQVTRICYTNVEEHWKPQMEGLEEIVANRQIPCIHILMSLDAIDDSIEGLQKPNTKTDFWVHSNSSTAASSQNRDNNGHRQQRPGQNRRPRQFKQPHEKQSQQNAPQEQQQNIPQQQVQEQQQDNQKRAKPRNRSPHNRQQPQQQQRQHKPQQRQQQVGQNAKKPREADVRKSESMEN